MPKNWRTRLEEVTEDTATTIAGYVAAGAGAAATAFIREGGLTKEMAAAWAVLGVCGYLCKRGSKKKAFYVPRLPKLPRIPK